MSTERMKYYPAGEYTEGNKLLQIKPKLREV